MTKISPNSKKGGLLVAWIAVALFGLVLVGYAFKLQVQMGGSYLAIPEIVGIVGVWMAIQGVVSFRRLRKKQPSNSTEGEHRWLG